MTTTLEPYDDGRWSLADHLPDPSATLWCRGNVGEVFPNVVTPLSASLYMGAMEVGQADAVRDWGMVTDAQYQSFEEGHGWLTGVFGGYLYGNVTLARSAVSRSPGLTVELVDEQMFGLSDAPPHKPSKGERDIRAAVKTMRKIASSMRRPDDSRLRADQAAIADYVSRQPTIATASNDELVAVARSMTPWARRMMHHLLLASMAAGISRSMLERVVASLREPGLENRLTAGLGTVESAEPAQELWPIGRMVAASPTLTAFFDERRFDEAASGRRFRRRLRSLRVPPRIARARRVGARLTDMGQRPDDRPGNDRAPSARTRRPRSDGGRGSSRHGARIVDPRDPESSAVVQAPAVRHRPPGHDGLRPAA